MDNNQENNNQGNKNGPNKFNINSYWIYGLIILGILAVNVFVSMNSQVENVDINAFEEMVKRGEVDKIEIINEKLVTVFLRE